jgi:hypothetical protein
VEQETHLVVVEMVYQLQVDLDRQILVVAVEVQVVLLVLQVVLVVQE